MGEQFVTGETIGEALANSPPELEAQGFRYSYDMLGEAAADRAADAQRYLRGYEQAIHAIGARPAAGRGMIEEPGISIKLSALHHATPCAGSKEDRVMGELLPARAAPGRAGQASTTVASNDRR